jgi:enamine deaminase RidA (YjgF/YER057c/UK114 family)
LTALGIVLPDPLSPIASYVTYSQVGAIGYLSGHGPLRSDGTWVVGKVGADIDVSAARDAARLTGLGLLATLQSALGSLDGVVKVIKLLGLVNCTPDFADHSAVIDGCSELLIDVFGDRGRHARSAIGVASLPMRIPVEIEMIVEVG